MSRVDTAGREAGWKLEVTCTHRDVERVHLGVFVGSKQHTCQGGCEETRFSQGELVWLSLEPVIILKFFISRVIWWLAAWKHWSWAVTKPYLRDEALAVKRCHHFHVDWWVPFHSFTDMHENIQLACTLCNSMVYLWRHLVVKNMTSKERFSLWNFSFWKFS